jgi:hypothetical protein
VIRQLHADFITRPKTDRGSRAHRTGISESWGTGRRVDHGRQLERNDAVLRPHDWNFKWRRRRRSLPVTAARYEQAKKEQRRRSKPHEPIIDQQPKRWFKRSLCRR